MITIFRKNQTSTTGNDREIELRGISTDEKPATIDGKDIANGTVFIEIDTGKLYMFDKENEQWKEM
jgi:hypothetical protein